MHFSGKSSSLRGSSQQFAAVARQQLFLKIIKGNLTTSRFKCVRKHPDFIHRHTEVVAGRVARGDQNAAFLRPEGSFNDGIQRRRKQIITRPFPAAKKAKASLLHSQERKSVLRNCTNVNRVFAIYKEEIVRCPGANFSDRPSI
jgi:hypothetical protein